MDPDLRKAVVQVIWTFGIGGFGLLLLVVWILRIMELSDMYPAFMNAWWVCFAITMAFILNKIKESRPVPSGSAGSRAPLSEV